uniref:hypothetical protein n=1 Tax=Streptococcus canis TaxID=1329 RepID=UPI00242B85BF|nr:hypothetical protein [Streptococcus canis]
MFNYTVDLIYESLVQRLENRRETIAYGEGKAHLTFDDLSTCIEPNGNEISYDKAMVKHVFGKKIYKDKNPYLLPHSCASHLTNRLRFKSETHLIWGEFEKGENFFDIFSSLFYDCIYGEDESLKEMANRILIDYVPYAKTSSLYEMALNPSKYDMVKMEGTDYYIPLLFYGIPEDKVFSDYPKHLDEAINFLYKKCSIEFEREFRDFVVTDGDTLKKIDKKLLKFINDRLQPLLLKYQPTESSLGLRVKNIMVTDWLLIGKLVTGQVDNRNYYGRLLQSSLPYIDELAKLQEMLR